MFKRILLLCRLSGYMFGVKPKELWCLCGCFVVVIVVGMPEYVRFIVFAHGEIVEGSSAPEYDRGLIKKVKVRVGCSFVQFYRIICQAAGIDPSTNRVEIIHIHLTYMSHGMSYMLMPIGDDEDLEGLMEMAKGTGYERIQSLFVRKCESANVTKDDHTVQENLPLTMEENTFCTYPAMGTQEYGIAYGTPGSYEAPPPMETSMLSVERAYEPQPQP